MTQLELDAACAAAAIFGAEMGALVTNSLHHGGGWPPGAWDRRLGRSRFRAANLPVGFVLVTGLSFLAPGDWAWVVRSGAVGMLVTAVGWAWVDPAR